jgi:hypothetical protein
VGPDSAVAGRGTLEHLVEPAVVDIPFVDAVFIAYPQIDEQGTGQAGAEADGVKKAELAVFYEAADRLPEISADKLGGEVG